MYRILTNFILCFSKFQCLLSSAEVTLWLIKTKFSCSILCDLFITQGACIIFKLYNIMCTLNCDIYLPVSAFPVSRATSGRPGSYFIRICISASVGLFGVLK